MTYISHLIIPLILAVVGVSMALSKKPLTDAFTEGAREGLTAGVRLIPTLVLLMTAVSMFNACGAAQWISDILAPLLDKIGIPSELTPLLIVRPISGGASTALATGIFEKYGADSFVGRCASILIGSSDTLLYIIAVYMAAGGVKRSRHAFISAFIVMLLCVFLSCLLVRLFFP